MSVDLPKVDLPPTVAEELRRGFSDLPTAEEDLEALLAGLVGVAGTLPTDVIKTILRLRADPSAPGVLLIRGVPVDEDLPPTPTESLPVGFDPAPFSRCAILLLAILLGEPVAYAAEKDGALVQDVFPTGEHQAAPSNESSSVSLGFHTELMFSRRVPEQSFDAAAPDFVLLLALRSLPGRSATTSFVEARDLCRLLEPEHLDTLRRPAFELQAPYSFTRNGDESRPWSKPLALVRGPRDAPSVVFDIACGIRGVSPDANAALQALREACSDPTIHRSVELGPGELIAIDNHKCAHARSRFEARFDGRDRWLRRVYVRRSLRMLEPDPDKSFRVLA